MSECVWVSNLMGNSEFVLPVTTDISVRDAESFMEAERLNKQGAAVPAMLCPRKIWGSDPGDPLDRVPDLFCARGMFFVSSRAASVLSKHDLGSGALHHVVEGLWTNDLTTRFPDEYFAWIFGNKKTAFAPEESPNKRAFGIAGASWNMPFVLKDGDIAVTRAALGGPDVWLDPTLKRSVFLSSEAGEEMSKAGLRKAFGLKKCRII